MEEWNAKKVRKLMTTILLHGGYGAFWEGAGNDVPFFTALADAACTADNKILISFLAQETPNDFPHLQELQNSFKQVAPQVELVIANRANFHELLPQHEVLFLQGGNSIAHHKFLEPFTSEDLKNGKKLLAGSSSGASLLCEYGFTGRANKPLKGKGIAPLCILPHANSWPKEACIHELSKVTTEPIICIDEKEFISVSINNG